jgi:cytochrome bd ubiquinol oxidase subunit II
MEPSHLALFWAGVIASAILIYVILDGFDLGVGVLFGTTRDEVRRVRMLDTIAPFWDGNETWLVVTGAGLYAAFPDAYAVFLGAFYFPVLLLLFGLIFRGIAFEFRFRSERMRVVWDWGFFLGSTVVAFVQGAAIGAMMRGIPVLDGQYAGGSWDWLHPFTILTGIGLVLGYALLGAGWLVLKSEGELRDWAYRRIRWLALGVIVVLFLAFTVTFDYSVLARSDLLLRPWGLAFPAIGVLALVGTLVGAQAPRQTSVRNNRALLSRRISELGGDVLAVHDSLFRYGSERGGACSFIAILLLWWHRCPAGHRRLHDRCLLGFPR